MAETKHTPLQWETKDIFQGSTDEIIAGGKRIALVVEYDKYGNKINDFAERKANAELIVKAVNSHALLIEALEAVQWWMENGEVESQKQGKPRMSQISEIVRTALKKSE